MIVARGLGRGNGAQIVTAGLGLTRSIVVSPEVQFTMSAAPRKRIAEQVVPRDDDVLMLFIL